MKLYNRILAAALAVAVLIPAASPVVNADAPKVSADEAVYVNLDYYGKTSQVNIVKGCSLNGNSQFTDYGSYNKVTNMTDETKPKVNGDSVTWNLAETTGRFYYECEPKSGTVNLPWTFNVSYKLNGVPADAKTLAGASGMVEIDVKATPNKNVSDYYKNNMLLQVGTAVKMKDNLSVEAPGAQVQSAGDYKMVLFAGLPGEEKTFTIRIGTKSFETIGVVMMMVPGTLEQLKDIKELKEAKDTVKGSMDSISQSTNEVLSTLESMSSGLKQTQSGLSSLDNARSSISSSKGAVYSNADKSLANLTAITTETSALVPHLQKAQLLVGDVNTSMDALIGKLNTTGTYLTSLSNSIGSVKKDVSDLRDDIDDLQDNSSSTKTLMTNLKTDLGTVKAGVPTLSALISQLSTQSKTLIADIAKLSAIQAAVSGNPAIQNQTATAIASLQEAQKTTDKIVASLNYLSSHTNGVLKTGDETVDVVSSYLNSLDDGLDTTDKLLKDTNKIGGSTQSLLSGAQEVIDSATALNGVMDQYKAGTVEALKDTENLTVGLTNGLTSAKGFLTSLETLMKTSGSSLDDGTRKSLSGLIKIMQQSLDGIGKTSSIKNANNTIKKTVDHEIDKYEKDNNLLNLNAEATPVSFTSSKNATPDSIQVVLRTEEISIDKNNDNTKDLEESGKDVGVFARMCNVFSQIWNSIVAAFSNK